MPAEGRGLGSRLALEVAKHGRLGQRSFVSELEHLIYCFPLAPIIHHVGYAEKKAPTEAGVEESLSSTSCTTSPSRRLFTTWTRPKEKPRRSGALLVLMRSGSSRALETAAGHPRP